jgi:hypothetical protein
LISRYLRGLISTACKSLSQHKILTYLFLKI